MITTGKKTAKYTAMDKLRYIGAVLPYIEKHLSEELHPESIARQHYISLSQLYRDFYACTGHSIKEYIRKRRISNACEKIKCSVLPLAIIADESGYQTQQAFHKQFKSVVGMTPLEYQQRDTYFYFYPFAVNKISLTVKVGTETIPRCKIIQFYDPCLMGIEDKAIAALGETAGRVFGRNGQQTGGQFCYEVMTETVGTGETDLYAACVVNYNEPEISDGWNYLYNIWLSASMFEEADKGYFEEYLFENGIPRKLKLYLPVKKRKTEKHIAILSVSETAFIISREKGYNAERKAAEKVMAFLQERHLTLLRTAQRFYVCIYDDIGVCGVECGEDFDLPDDSGLELLRIPGGRYAVLPDDCLGDIRIGGAKIELWLQNNSIAHEKEPVFAVYETLNGKYDNENIRMELFKRLRNDKNG
ncbi:AraC-like DNA-binding protein/DNA gyrase inhibitor GyrI [Anaerotaenia torta]|uniref:AraC family transcriptional regulator n=1 Tax=Anaerotaenia torta TaxID=433293 RepID=UPI003D213205